MAAIDEARQAKRHLDAGQLLFEQAVIRAYQSGCSLRDFEIHNVGITGSGAAKILQRHGVPLRPRSSERPTN